MNITTKCRFPIPHMLAPTPRNSVHLVLILPNQFVVVHPNLSPKSIDKSTDSNLLLQFPFPQLLPMSYLLLFALPGQPPSTNKGQPPSTNKGQSPTNNKGQSPTNNKGQPPSTNKGQSPTINKGQSPTINKGQSPTTDVPYLPAIWVMQTTPSYCCINVPISNLLSNDAIDTTTK